MNELLTDNEIMKNVRCCADNYCKNCSLQGKPNCKNTLFSLAWNTIYDLKAENERLEKHNSEYKFCNLLENALIYTKTLKDYNDLRKAFKVHAIKEFAERLKNHKRKMSSSDWGGDFWDEAVLVSEINNLVKEMEK